MADLKLYYRTTCPYCQKVLSFITGKGINVPLADIGEREDFLNELISVGGKKQVPCLFIDGKPLYESNDIIEWLDHNQT